MMRFLVCLLPALLPVFAHAEALLEAARVVKIFSPTQKAPIIGAFFKP